MMKINKLTGIDELLAFALLAAAVLMQSINAGINKKNELPESKNHNKNNYEVKNIIFMIPHSMDLADVIAARIYKSGPGAPLYFETLANIGYQRTYSVNSIITDTNG